VLMEELRVAGTFGNPHSIVHFCNPGQTYGRWPKEAPLYPWPILIPSPTDS
jgi:hypothetical protein